MALTTLMILAIFAVLALGLLAVVVGVVLLVVRGSRPRPQAVGASTSWNLMVFGDDPIGRMGGTLGAERGRLEITDGHVGYWHDGAVEPAWRVPCAALAVRSEPVGLRGVRTLSILGPDGPMRCAVSRERIDQAVSNPLKDLREAGYATELHRALLAHGARHW